MAQRSERIILGKAGQSHQVAASLLLSLLDEGEGVLLRPVDPPAAHQHVEQ